MASLVKTRMDIAVAIALLQQLVLNRQQRSCSSSC